MKAEPISQASREPEPRTHSRLFASAFLCFNHCPPQRNQPGFTFRFRQEANEQTSELGRSIRPDGAVTRPANRWRKPPEFSTNSEFRGFIHADSNELCSAESAALLTAGRHNAWFGQRTRHRLITTSTNHNLLNIRGVHGGPVSTPTCDLRKRTGATHSDAGLDQELAINRARSSGAEISLRLCVAHASTHGASRSKRSSDLPPSVHAGAPQ